MKPHEKPKPPLKWILLALIAGVLGFWWHQSPPPLVGGGKPESILARWVKSRVYATVSPAQEKGLVQLSPDNFNSWQSIFAEPIQSLEWYKRQNPTRPTPQRKVIVLQPLGEMSAREKKLLEDLKEYSAAFFQLPVRIAPPISLEKVKAWSRSKGKSSRQNNRQYDAGKIVDRLLAPRLPADAAAYLGITMADLWADNLHFVFGLGSFEQRAGVYSLGRYFPEFWGRKRSPGGELEDEKLALRRSCQVLNHEAGHMFGLMHCVLYKCSMNGANGLSDADATPLEYCPICDRKLQWNIGLDATRRERELLGFYQRKGLGEEENWLQKRMEHRRQAAAGQ